MEHLTATFVDSWRELYVAALFETDNNRLAERILAAEAAILKRAQQLFDAPGDHIEEIEALDDAMYALSALRNTYQCVSPSDQYRTFAA